MNVLLTLSGIHWRFTVFPQWDLLQSCLGALLVWLETSVFTARLSTEVSKTRYPFLPNGLDRRWLLPNHMFRSWFFFSPVHSVFLFINLVAFIYASSLRAVLVNSDFHLGSSSCSSCGKPYLTQFNKFARRFTTFDLFIGSFISDLGFAWQ